MHKKDKPNVAKNPRDTVGRNTHRENISTDILVFRYTLIGPSEVLGTSGANLGRPLVLVNYSALVIVVVFVVVGAPVVKIPEGVVLGFQILAWAPN